MRPFELVEPRRLREAIDLLDPDDPTVRPIAGGTALMLMMKSGVFKPSRLISLRGVEARYSQIEGGRDGSLRIGALTPLGVLERSPEVRRAAPVIVDTLRTLSNVRVRNVATVGGHLAHADPHMDLPPVLIALEAEIGVIGPGGENTMPVADLFAGYYETSLDKRELIAELIIPPQRRRAAYVKCTTRSADDWPALGVAVALDVEGQTIRDARIAVSAATERPMRLTAAESTLRGKVLENRVLKLAGEAAAAEATTVDDVRGSADYKQALLRVYVARAVRKAMGTAR